MASGLLDNLSLIFIVEIVLIVFLLLVVVLTTNSRNYTLRILVQEWLPRLFRLHMLLAQLHISPGKFKTNFKIKLMLIHYIQRLTESLRIHFRIHISADQLPAGISIHARLSLIVTIYTCTT